MTKKVFLTKIVFLFKVFQQKRSFSRSLKGPLIFLMRSTFLKEKIKKSASHQKLVSLQKLNKNEVFVSSLKQKMLFLQNIFCQSL